MRQDKDKEDLFGIACACVQKKTGGNRKRYSAMAPVLTPQMRPVCLRITRHPVHGGASRRSTMDRVARNALFVVFLFFEIVYFTYYDFIPI